VHITIFAVGSRGDIQPFVALGKALAEAGHQVRMASHLPYQSFIESFGLGFAPITGNPQALLQGGLAKSWLESGRNPIRFVRRFNKLSADFVDQYLEDSYQAGRHTEAILYSSLGVAAYHLAEYWRIPCISVPLQPLARTRSHPAIFFPSTLRWGGPINWATHLLLEQLLWQPYRQKINQWRQEKLNLPPFPFTGPLPMIYRGFHPTLYGVSPQVYPKPADYPAHHHITGYWFLDCDPAWEPPAALEDFLAAGDPPIYFGLGSMTSNEPAKLAQTVSAAFKSTNQRGVFLSGWGELAFDPSDQDLYIIDSVPHDWLFPRMRAVIHHGGAGTTAAGLRAGKPTLILPFFGDQPYWGDRVEALGIGPRPIRQERLTIRALTAALRNIVTDSSMQANAQEIGEKIRAEQGLQNAVALIEQYLARPESVPQFI
jgi:UDP:flavonoid glycosyltransferase YjiC (YdhE family)